MFFYPCSLFIMIDLEAHPLYQLPKCIGHQTPHDFIAVMYTCENRVEWKWAREINALAMILSYIYWWVDCLAFGMEHIDIVFEGLIN